MTTYNWGELVTSSGRLDLSHQSPLENNLTNLKYIYWIDFKEKGVTNIQPINKDEDNDKYGSLRNDRIVIMTSTNESKDC